MQLLSGAGSFEVLTPIDHLLEQLLIIERAGRVCYQSEKREPTLTSARRFIRKLLKRGHESVIEHSSLTVRFSNVSRGFTHELVRHRLCAFSQESTRYVDESDLHFVLPPGVDPDTALPDFTDSSPVSVGDAVACAEWVYGQLLKLGWKREDARQFLPIGVTSQIVATANLREWRHIFRLRCAKPAHWEIRRVMGLLLEHVQPVLEPVFDDLEVDGVCRHGVPYWTNDEVH